MPAPLPVSAIQAAAVESGVLPPLEEFRPGIRSVALPFGDGIDDHSLGYLIEGDDGALTMIDPGWHGDENVGRVDEALQRIGRSVADIAVVAITHLHVDHLGAADEIRRASGARLAMHRLEQDALLARPDEAVLADIDIAGWGAPAEAVPDLVRFWGTGRTLPPIHADILLDDGDLLPAAGRRVQAVWTPGHTSGHLCFLELDERLLFTGDHVLPRVNPGIGLGGRSATNPLADFLESLDRVSTLTDDGPLEVCPGHEYRFDSLAERCRALRDHRGRRSTVIAGILDELDHPTLWQVADRMPWRGGFSAMSGYRLASAVAQTGFHVDVLGRADELSVGGPD